MHKWIFENSFWNILPRFSSDRIWCWNIDSKHHQVESYWLDRIIETIVAIDPWPVCTVSISIISVCNTPYTEMNIQMKLMRDASMWFVILRIFPTAYTDQITRFSVIQSKSKNKRISFKSRALWRRQRPMYWHFIIITSSRHWLQKKTKINANKTKKITREKKTNQTAKLSAHSNMMALLKYSVDFTSDTYTYSDKNFGLWW